MKIVIKTLISIVLVSFAMSGRLRGKPGLTPKASDLGDHFGTEPARGIYGPKPVIVSSLMREGVTGKDTPITPIHNFHQEINPTAVSSGDLNNTAYDSSKIIRPIIAGIYIFYLFNKLNFIYFFFAMK
jgi:hypothetical protein